MTEKNELVQFSSSEILFVIEPNNNPHMYRFAIFNQGGSRIKFLNNEKWYSVQEVRSSQSEIITFKRQDGCGCVEAVHYITDFGLPTESDYKKRKFRHKYYTTDTLQQMVNILSPLLENKSHKIPLQQFLLIEKKLAEYQRPLIKEIEKELAIIKATNEYCNF